MTEQYTVYRISMPNKLIILNIILNNQLKLVACAISEFITNELISEVVLKLLRYF
jgi:hypothetical protein